MSKHLICCLPFDQAILHTLHPTLDFITVEGKNKVKESFAHQKLSMCSTATLLNC